MQAKLLTERDCEGGPRPEGTVIDHPDAFRLVEDGVAEPADDECRSAIIPWIERKAREEARLRTQLAAEESRLLAEQELFEKMRRDEFESLLREGNK